MKARITTLTLALFAVVAVSGLSAQDGQQGTASSTAKAQDKFVASCPISGGAASEENFIERNGKKIYFCCPNCSKAFEASPEKFAATVNYQLLQTKQMVQVGCPLSGGPIAGDKKVKIGTTEVDFCCQNCQGKIAKMDQKEQVATVFGSAAKGFTMQTKCPVSGQPISTEHTVKHEGTDIYFCCPNCKAGFEKDPAKYADKVAHLIKKDAGK
ncbi:MAG: TRASH domain-containing protein [Pirellulales bacterium]|nr:TRASH domain-containing protein [Pirellulales bacterium]